MVDFSAKGRWSSTTGIDDGDGDIDQPDMLLSWALLSGKGIPARHPFLMLTMGRILIRMTLQSSLRPLDCPQVSEVWTNGNRQKKTCGNRKITVGSQMVTAALICTHSTAEFSHHLQFGNTSPNYLERVKVQV